MNYIGIDFGTTNSLAAIRNNGMTEILEFQGYKSTPTVLFFPDQKHWTSKYEQPYYVGHNAIERRFIDGESGRLLFSFKGLLADKTFDSTIIQGYGQFTAEKLCGFFLKKMKTAAESFFEKEFSGVVLGRPVEFSELAVNRLEEAARVAGFKNIRFQLEPIAAGLNFEQSLKIEDGEKLVFICDIGGGTTDYSILRISSKRSQSHDRTNDVLSIGGIYKAGDTLNSDIVVKGLAEKFGKGAKWGEKQLDIPSHLIHALGNWKTISFLRREQIGSMANYTEPHRRKDVERLSTLVHHNLGYMLHSEVDKAKIQLSSNDHTEIRVPDLDLSQQITKETFEKLISKTVDEIKVEIFATLGKAKVTPNDISTVIMTGGSSLVPALQQMAHEIFDPHKIINVNPFDSVVGGLALEAEKFS